MDFPKKECAHISAVLRKAVIALKERNSVELKSLSNQTIHDSCSIQDPESISIAVIIYALSKLIEREDYNKIKSWHNFSKRISMFLETAASAIEKKEHERYSSNLQKARASLTSISVNLRPYIDEVLKKASINKASKIYEHGISMERTAKLLGVSQWDLTDYIGQKEITPIEKIKPLDIKKRIKIAEEFFA